ncbi:MAG: FAD:protein FMN transferase [Paracoccus sp. (in: a-proteobacteria)]|uniref:FAD:protein FMN transferase n=1 Tax=Paracoccus sp. TaxID=267 RepID=UPI0026E10370|nr:FAD:protein FMN transferase [Paracoccus sp. (in: a-proteobacteria)]MDO5630308.1 FAD:protein FMN transferase [Paracoccus sp. (in: a-proteobacteria)]
MKRRRFLTISAGMLLVSGLPAVAAPRYAQWRGQALGARATITLDRHDPALFAAIRAEIERLEAVFSLYRPDSALVRLNKAGRLDAPPPELVECLTLAGRAHRATGGLFDPTVQPLWLAYADAQGAPDPAQLAALPMGWDGVSVDAAVITLRRGMALTLNGIAQGFIADQVAALIRARGYDHVMVDTGELSAVGTASDGGPWPVSFDGGGRTQLADRALASSSPLGMTLGGGAGHILNPQTRQPASPHWRLVSVSSPSAAVADALSTAFCLMQDAVTMVSVCEQFRDTRVEALRIA